MSATVYDVRKFWVRRTIRMHAHAGAATTKQAEAIAMHALDTQHSVANALSTANRYLRSVRQVEPKGAA